MFILSMSLISKAFAPDSIFGRDRREHAAVSLKPSTRRSVESHLRRHILPLLGECPLTDLTVKKMQTFVTTLSTGKRTAKTIENVLLTLSSIMGSARKWGYKVPEVPLSDLWLPRGVKAKPRCYSEDEMIRIKARTSLLTRLRPPTRLTLEIQVQYKRNPARCQFTTVLGVTNTRGFPARLQRNPEQLVQGSQSTARSLRVQSQQIADGEPGSRGQGPPGNGKR
jgi:Phage integrase, N-terminal SAM-like domain